MQVPLGALLAGPKIESGDKHGTRHHAKETITANGVQWIYEKKDVGLAPTSMQLIRVMIGKVEDKHRLQSILHRVPIRADARVELCWVGPRSSPGT